MNRVLLVAGIVLTALGIISIATVQIVNFHCGGSTLNPPIPCPHLDPTVPILLLLVGLALSGYSFRAKPKATRDEPRLDSEDASR